MGTECSACRRRPGSEAARPSCHAEGAAPRGTLPPHPSRHGVTWSPDFLGPDSRPVGARSQIQTRGWRGSCPGGALLQPGRQTQTPSPGPHNLGEPQGSTRGLGSRTDSPSPVLSFFLPVPCSGLGKTPRLSPAQTPGLPWGCCWGQVGPWLYRSMTPTAGGPTVPGAVGLLKPQQMPMAMGVG